jgi:hypothetical protein
MKNQGDSRAPRRAPSEPEKPAGNAARDPGEQTLRKDLPPDAQQRGNEPGRGTASPESAEPPRQRADRTTGARGGDAVDPALEGDIERSGG